MKRFWAMVGLILATLLLGVMIVADNRQTGAYRPGIAVRIFSFAFFAMLVFVVWAICFRPQIEQRRLKLSALFALTAMEALLCWAIRYFGTFGQ